MNPWPRVCLLGSFVTQRYNYDYSITSCRRVAMSPTSPPVRFPGLT